MPLGVQLRMARVIMALDVEEAHGLGHAALVIEIAEIARQVLVIGDAADVALECPT